MLWRFSELGNAGGKGTLGSLFKFFLVFAERDDKLKSVDVTTTLNTDAEWSTSHAGTGESQDEGSYPKPREAPSQNHDCAAVKLEPG